MRPSILPLFALSPALFLALGCSASADGAAAPDPAPAERLGRASAAIVGGTETTDFPAVGYVEADYGSYRSGCTGTLIRLGEEEGDSRVFLTAAHCLEEEGSERIRGVRVTFEPKVATATKYHTAARWASHPQYGRPFPGDPIYYINRGYDCAVVLLNEPVADVAAVRLDEEPMTAMAVGTAVTQVGYGFTSGRFTGSGIKRMLTTRIGSVYDGVLGLVENGTGTCQGDSGGPTLLTKNGTTHVSGVSSYGSHGCPGGGWMSRAHLCAEWIRSEVARGAQGGGAEE
jgi:hypothetical protein